MAPLPRVVSVTVLLAALALSAKAYIDPNSIYIFNTDLTVQNVYGNSNQNTGDRGYAFFSYSPSSMTLSYWLYDNLSVQKTSSALNGPSLCMYVNSQGNVASDLEDPGSNGCYANTGPQQVLLSTLPSGPTISTVTLSSAQEDMLFDNELYVLISSTLLPNGHLGGHLYFYSLTPSSSTFLNIQQQGGYMLDFVFLGANNGQFSSESSPSTSNTGIIVLWYYLNSNNQADYVYYTIFHSVNNPGVLTLKCPNVGGIITFPTSTSGSYSQLVNFDSNGINDLNMIPELFQTGACYFKMTSAQYNNGELYGRVVRAGAYEFIATGSGTADFVSCMADFDQGSKILGFVCYSNITSDSVTSVQVWDTNSNTLLCTVGNTTNNVAPTTTPGTPFTTVQSFFYCQVNSSYVNDIINQNVAITVTTLSAPNGAVTGKMVYNSDATGFQSGSGGLSQAGVIAIAVIFSILGVALIAGLVFFVYRQGYMDRMFTMSV